MIPSRSFTLTADGRLNVLISSCGVSQPFNPKSGETPPPTCNFDAIWDTGATNTVITQAVIDKCGLVATGMTKVHGVSGSSLSETYLVNIALPNNVVFPSIHATKGDFPGANALIGMDIINKGDFAITNLGGVTKFSFRIPSQKHIDFVEESRKQSQISSQHKSKKTDRPKHHKTFGINKKKK